MCFVVGHNQISSQSFHDTQRKQNLHRYAIIPIKFALPLPVVTGSIRFPGPFCEWQNLNKKAASRQDPETLNQAGVCGIIGFQGTERHKPLNADYRRFHCVPLDGDSSSLLRGGKHLMGSVFSEEERRKLSDKWILQYPAKWKIFKVISLVKLHLILLLGFI